ncbi:MAG: DUF378 domain-containing protein [Patescibacteria group bacterium]
MKTLHSISFILLVVGGLNWLLEAFNWNFVMWLADLVNVPLLADIIYVLVGLAAIYEVVTHKNRCKDCSAPAGGAMM